MWRFFWRKNDASIRVPNALARQEGNNPDVWSSTFSKFLNVAVIFWSCFLDTACISNEDFLSKAGMCFGCLVVAIDTVLQSLKGKILLAINKSWVQNFTGYESKCSNQNTTVVQFYPWQVAIPYLRGANDQIEIDNF